MKKLLIAGLIASTTLIFGCSQSDTKTEGTTAESNSGEQTEENTTAGCVYTYNGESTKVKWTAYKTTAKVGVSGVFTQMGSDAPQKETSVPNMLNGGRFEIQTTSINSENEERDGKIREFFFGSMANPLSVRGELNNAKGDDESGTLSITLSINDSKQMLEARYSVDDTYLDITTQMRLPEIGLGDAAKAMNKACYELHKGEDGESKLGDEVDILITTVLMKKCS